MLTSSSGVFPTVSRSVLDDPGLEPLFPKETVFGGQVGFFGRSPAAETGDVIVGTDRTAAGERQGAQTEDVFVEEAVVLMPFALDADRESEELGGVAVHHAGECGKELRLSDRAAGGMGADLDVGIA